MAEMKRGYWSAASLTESPGADTARLVAELRDLFGEHPGLARGGPETIRRALQVLRGVVAGAFEVEAAREALRVEGEVLP